MFVYIFNYIVVQCTLSHEYMKEEDEEEGKKKLMLEIVRFFLFLSPTLLFIIFENSRSITIG